MKTPLPFLFFLAASVRTAGKSEAAARGEMLSFVWAPVCLWMAAVCFSHFQIGLRHVLPIYPFCCVAGGVAIARFWGTDLGKARWGACLLLLWYAAGTLFIQPHYLAYFNEASGGPREGYKRLIDSNQDWGQELKSLGQEEGSPSIYLSYFGTADPHAYGIRYVPLSFVTELPREGDAVEPFRSRRILFAISATNLSSAYTLDKTFWRWLEGYEPYKVLGYSLFVYDFTERPEALQRIAQDLFASGDRARGLALAKWLDQMQMPRPQPGRDRIQ
jgi:hypothetical protein